MRSFQGQILIMVVSSLGEAISWTAKEQRGKQQSTSRDVADSKGTKRVAAVHEKRSRGQQRNKKGNTSPRDEISRTAKEQKG
ncbi:hypothetical protein [Ureibacillus sp. GCM10028918]|uniref:hypothetical protein n=1 Tax=Ureibacillus sp. GCM10028918 TaxID=3273429 RepID=UPI0036076E9F